MTATGRAVAGLAAAAIVAGTALAAAPPAMSAARRAQADAAAAGTPARPDGPGWPWWPAAARPGRLGWPAPVPAAARGALSRALGQSDPRYRAVRAGRGWTARNPAQHLAAVFAPGRVTVHAGALAVAMAVRGYGYTGQPGPARAGRPTAPAAAGNVVRYRQGRLTAWYANGPAGLEQGFTLAAPPPDRARGHLLRLDLAVSGNARALAAPGGQVIFRHRSQALRYGELVVTDASGRRLPARIVPRHGGLDLVTDTTGARYPLRIDPVIYTQAKLTASGGAANDILGWSVAVSGATIAAGAPGATVNGNPGQGAVYVFTRAGGTWTQAAKLTASGEQPGLLGGGLGDDHRRRRTLCHREREHRAGRGVCVHPGRPHLDSGRQAHRLRRRSRRQPGPLGRGLGDHHRRRRTRPLRGRRGRAGCGVCVHQTGQRVGG